MKTRLIPFIAIVAILGVNKSEMSAQVVLSPVFNQLRLEARADFDVQHNDANGTEYGFQGKYFNMLIGGSLSDKFSYFFRQRIIANSGSVSLFDNTDFLYLNFTPSQNWMFRLGKDALAVGGFEYDAPPIDVLFNTVYWGNFYCFQTGASTAYKNDDGNQMVMVQVSNSPYVHFGGHPWNSGLLSYSLFWSGTFGHFKTLYSVNMFEHSRGAFMNYIALGNKLQYDRWDWYVDFMHHALASDDWGKNFAIVSCLNFLVTDNLNLFAKVSYEQNHSASDYESMAASGTELDCLVESGHSYLTYGIGFEYRPAICRDVRLHGFVTNTNVRVEDAGGNELNSTDNLRANIGITWHMNIHRMFMERGLK